MKELSIEEKAIAYDKAIKEAAISYKDEDRHLKATLERIFPKLKESEDCDNKRISKEITQFLKQNNGWNKEWLSWLEKQKPTEWSEEDERIINSIIHDIRTSQHYDTHSIGEYDKKVFWLKSLRPQNTWKPSEQKPVDKVEPKFKVGDWAVSNLDKKARQISEVHFDEYNSYYVVDGKSVNLEEYDRLHHLWTIEDAKDGDLLVDEDNNIGIFRECEGIDWNSYIYLGCDGKLRGFSIGAIHRQTDTHPATKEQCDTLMKAVADAGYTFDFEKKELKKIEQTPAWSEDDKKKYIGELQSLMFEWSNRKENMGICIDRHIDKLLSLHPQSHWKPSDEQMYNLKWVGNVLLSHHDSIVEKDSAEKLNSLYEDLKKLMEE